MSMSVGTTTRMLARLDDDGIRYCHWKSNSHLEAGLAGLTDLDLLFDESQKDEIHHLLAETGFTRFRTHPSRSYESMEDFLGVEEVSGRLLHLHVQYRILVGAKHLKDYWLPWEQILLATRVRDARFGVFVADPRLELLLLVVRAAMKIRLRSRIRIPGKTVGPPDGFGEEHLWLSQQASTEQVLRLSEQQLGKKLTKFVRECLISDMEFRSLVRLRRALRRQLKGRRTHGRLAGNFLRWRREARWFIGAINRRFIHAPIAYSRGGPGGGLIVAITGSDGSGKSTLTGEIHRWLARKSDVTSIYFGSGDGPASALRRPLLWAREWRKRRRPATPVRSARDNMNRKVTLSLVIWSLVLAREKHKKLNRAMRARKRGFVVLCDRYPQAEIGGINDGRMLHTWEASGSGWKRLIAELESRPYRRAEQLGPDLVLRLRVSPAVAHLRKPSEGMDKLELRQEIVESLRFPGARRGVIDIDADQGLKTVLLAVKQELWPEL